MQEMENAYNILIEKPEGKGDFGRSRCRWQDNIKTNLKEIQCRMSSVFIRSYDRLL